MVEPASPSPCPFSLSRLRHACPRVARQKREGEERGARQGRERRRKRRGGGRPCHGTGACAPPSAAASGDVRGAAWGAACWGAISSIANAPRVRGRGTMQLWGMPGVRTSAAWLSAALLSPKIDRGAPREAAAHRLWSDVTLSANFGEGSVAAPGSPGGEFAPPRARPSWRSAGSSARTARRN